MSQPVANTCHVCREAKEKNRESWYMAYIMDTNDEERAKGKTVEVGAGIVHPFVGVLALPLALNTTLTPNLTSTVGTRLTSC